LTERELEAEINLVPFMNPAPFSVQEECPTSRVYRLYDAMLQAGPFVYSQQRTAVLGHR
jgi:hypothetical protein